MRRFLFVLIVMLFTISAHAQLNVVNVHGEIRDIAILRLGGCKLCWHDGNYYISMESSNRFDHRGVFYVGHTKESTIVTLCDLRKLIKTIKKNSVEVNDAQGNHVYISKCHGALFFDIPGIAGDCCAYDGELESMIQALIHYQEDLDNLVKPEKEDLLPSE